MLTDRLDITIVVDWDVKPQIKQNRKKKSWNLNITDLCQHYSGETLFLAW